MCTLTLLPLQTAAGRALRLGFNRDESRRRAPAISPRRFTCGGHNIVMPIDPGSTGTWIALSDTGVALAIMNVNPRVAKCFSSRQSRGAVIPALLAAESLENMRDAARALPLNDFAPFRLVLATTEEAIVFEHGPGGTDEASHCLDKPTMFASSGLGDDVVESTRRELFNEMLRTPSPSGQDAFHRHQWPDRPHLSVCMSRPDARTVSHTLIHLAPTRGTMVYFPDAPNQPIQPEIHPLDVRRPEFACS